MPLPAEYWQEDYLEPGPQDLPPGSDTQAAPSGITEDPTSVQGIEARSDNPSQSNGEGSQHLGHINQASHSKSVESPTEVNLDAEKLALPSGEENNVTSQSSWLIPEYANLRI